MTTALATRRENLLPDAGTWATMMSMAKTLVESGLLPQAVKTPAAALAIMQKGAELGIPPMYALSNIGVINGKPVVGAEVMLAMVYRDHGDQAIQFEETSADRCAVIYKRKNWAQARRFEWTTEDAKKAGLYGKAGTWSQYPAAMLRARCVSALARLAFPDCIGGMHTPEELGAEVTVNHDGEIEVVASPPPVVTIVPNAADVTPAPNGKRARWEAALQRGIAKAKSLGADVDDIDPTGMGDEELKNNVEAIAGMVKDIETSLAQQPAAPDDADEAF